MLNAHPRSELPAPRLYAGLPPDNSSAKIRIRDFSDRSQRVTVTLSGETILNY